MAPLLLWVLVGVSLGPGWGWFWYLLSFVPVWPRPFPFLCGSLLGLAFVIVYLVPVWRPFFSAVWVLAVFVLLGGPI